jgi:hypothetical protein
MKLEDFMPDKYIGSIADQLDMSPEQRIDFEERMKRDPDEYDFGWEFFTAASETLKRQYLSIALYRNLVHNLPSHVAKLIAKSWSGAEPHEDSYIDHQSLWTLPSEFNTQTPDIEFFADLKKFVLQPQVVILGGNDNDEADHPDLSKGTRISLQVPIDTHSASFVCRYDPQGYWSLFNRKNGTKIRLSFEDMGSRTKFEKATWPELVDVKISNFCPFGCEHCYQSSGTDGHHAKTNDISNIAYYLSQNKVFEVALGGGETTMHPDFASIVRTFANQGVVPNFTTRSLSWLYDPGIWRPVMEDCGRFAFSVHRAEDVDKLKALLNYNEINLEKVSIQIVMGTMDEWEYSRIIERAGRAGLAVTLLGYKTAGRGQNVKPKKYNWWLDSYKKLRESQPGYSPSLSIDTTLAAEYEQQLLAADIPSWMFHTKDGTFSMYIDAVERKVGPSSYCTESQMQDFDSKKDLADVFAALGE